MIDTSDHKLRKCLQNSPQANSISLSGASQVPRNIFLTLQITRGLSLSAPKYCQSMATIENIFPFIDKTRLEQNELVISECDKKIRDCSIFKRRKHTMHKKQNKKFLTPHEVIRLQLESLTKFSLWIKLRDHKRWNLNCEWKLKRWKIMKIFLLR